MKFNFVLRAAGALLLVAVVSVALVAATGAKYITAKDAPTGSATVAKFSFVEGARKYNQAAHDWYADTVNIDNTDAAAEDPAKYWREIAITAGTPTLFSIPLFDYEYYGTGGAVTVQAYNYTATPDLLAAPGIGASIGEVKNNPNTLTVSRHGNSKAVSMKFWNRSQVAVRFKITVDSSKTTFGGLPIDNKIPLAIFDPHAEFSTDISGLWVPISRNPVITWNDYDRWNDGIEDLYPPKTPAAGLDVFYDRWDDSQWPGMGTNAADYWMILEPNEEYTFAFSWLWWYNGPGDYATAFHEDFLDTDANRTRVDLRDTALGIAGREYLEALAGGNAGEIADALAAATVKLGFKLEVEQVD